MMVIISVEEVILDTFTTQGAAHQEVLDPVAVCGELRGHFGIEGRAVDDEQHPHICVPFAQVGEGSVQCQWRLHRTWICRRISYAMINLLMKHGGKGLETFHLHIIYIYSRSTMKLT